MQKRPGGSAMIILLIILVVLLVIGSIFTLIFSRFGGRIDKSTGSSVIGGNTACVDTNLLDIDNQPDVLARVGANLSAYQGAADKFGISWQMLAALHVRETNARSDNPANGEGPFQLTSLKNRDPNHPALKSLSAAAEFAAEALAKDYSNRYKQHTSNQSLGELTPAAPNELIQGTFWAYNGLVGTLDVSSYVWNHFDPAHNGPDQKGMYWPKEHSVGRNGNVRDTRDGAFSIYAFLAYSTTIQSGKIVPAQCNEGGTLVAGVKGLPSTNGLAAPTKNWSKFLPLNPHHKGYDDEVAVDVGMSTGTELYSISNGKVVSVFVDDGNPCGNGIKITGQGSLDGVSIVYCHLKSRSSLRQGDTIGAGEFAGHSGNTGSSSGPHLHLQGVGGFLNQYPRPNSGRNSEREKAWRQFLSNLPQ